MQPKPTPTELPDEWRTLAAQQRRLGADSQARILDFSADELAAALRRAGDEVLTLARAAQESGYTYPTPIPPRQGAGVERVAKVEAGTPLKRGAGGC
jgi:hypothetical protein